MIPPRIDVSPPGADRLFEDVCVNGHEECSDQWAGPCTKPKPSQADRLLDALRQGPVCSFRFYDHPGITHRVAARVHDLRKAGWRIDSTECDLHPHDARAVLYTLVTT